MLQETWITFPRQIVQRINGLLDQARPTQLKAFHLYKMCKTEDLWDKSFSEFSYLLDCYYQTHPVERSKSQFDQFLNRPMDWRSYESVNLNFYTADIGYSEVRNVAEWAHHMLRLQYKRSAEYASIDTLTKTIFDLTHPGFGGKEQNIEFEDFCNAWKAAADKIFGKKYEAEHEKVISDLRHLNHKLETAALEAPRRSLLDRIYLTQTEITWIERVLEAVTKQMKMPKYPLSKGPSKTRLVDLLKWLTLWEISKDVPAPAVQAKVIRLRDHIRNDCEELLAICRR